MDLKKIQNLKERLEVIKSDNQEKEAMRKVLLNQLKKEYNVSSLAESKKLYTKIQKEFMEKQDELDDKFEEIVKGLEKDGII